MAKNKVYALIIQGLVQGVGFRPFIYRIAKDLGMKGCVENMNNGVRILVAATPDDRDLLISRIRTEHPRVAYIHRISYTSTEMDEDDFDDFTITPSHSESDEVTQVSPDIAVCADCMRDRTTQPHRIGYPFINCTHCGPRFSIIRDLPYDRSQTTMGGFLMCPDCEKEYTNVIDRRFHAQPVACNHCGPTYYATYNEETYIDYETLLKLTSRLLLGGEVIAAKGIGGYHLICDASNERAVARLREIKQRDTKPFAVMFRDLEHLQVYTATEPMEERCLVSWRRPIVLLRQRSRLASGINPGMHTLGCMLSYMPIHYDWFARTGVIAAKGIGGYHLICDASNERAVARLREIKQRDTKPFAVMFRDLEHLQVYTATEPMEERCLVSWRRPIVLLRQRSRLASGINPGMHTLGCMLSYMPIHYDWFARTGIPALVMTSGNLSDLPIAITPEDAEAQLAGKVAILLHHNRPIHNRVDDSVLQVCGGQPCLIRRSRGYVPEPFFTDTNVEGIMAFGAEKVNTFALGKGETILQSQYIGDLKNWETFRFYTESMERFRHLFRFNLQRLVCDLHPDYLSSQEAERISKSLSLPLLKVQHHHAHAAACMLEHGLNEPVLAIVMDGTGLGDDGKVWGGEFFFCDRAKYRRLSHFEYVPLPGGDKAAEEPWRMVVAYLWHYFKDEPSGIPYPADFVERIGTERIAMLERMMEKGVNTPYTSSAGRLFDAVASLLGICDVSSHQAEAPVLLEQAAMGERNAYAYPVSAEGEEISFYSLFEALLHDKTNEVPVSLISARFHTTLASLFVQKARLLIKRTKATQVVISGGCFQNKLLTESMRRQFIMAGVPVYIPSRIPCNDGGIAVGQLTIASVTPF